MHPLKDYYFLSVSLPELKLGHEPEITWPEVETLLEDNLRKNDFKQVEIILRIFDLYNVRSWWQKLPMGFVGNWDANQVQRRLLDQEDLPKYLEKYLEKWEEDRERIQHFPELLSEYYEKEGKNGGSFLLELLDFEEKLKLVVTSIRAKRNGVDLESESVFRRDIPFVQDLLGLDDAPYPEPFEGLPQLFEKWKENPLNLDHALDAFRFQWIEERIDFDPFSIKHILGYVVQFLMVEKEAKHKKETERDLIEKIVKDISDE